MCGKKKKQAPKFGVIDEKYKVVLSKLKEVVFIIWCGVPCQRTLGLPGV